MLDLRLVREEAERVRRLVEARGVHLDLDRLLGLDGERRRLLARAEELRHAKNLASEQVGGLKQAGRSAEAEIARVRELTAEIKGLDGALKAVEEELESLLLLVPNLPHALVPIGRTAQDNHEIRRWGTPRTFDFPPRPHWEVGEALGLLDLGRAAKIAGTRFPLLIGLGARLERALINFMLDLHTREHGYTEVLPPLLVSGESMTGTGQLPKFAHELFRTADDPLYLIPTAEVPVTNIHRDEILPAGTLPRAYVAYTPCFRREAGSYGKDTRGLIRQHQFNKVELMIFAEPPKSYEALERLTADAEKVLQRLGLPYRVVALCTGDLGFAAARTYDLEVWFPAEPASGYREISSCSNCEAFQARRAGIRYRPTPTAKAEFVHTLNGSALAVGRTWAALIENYQEADGSVTIPEVLRPYMDGIARIEPH